jgi:hypothetical protein
MDLKNYFLILSEKRILLSELGIKPRIYSAWKDADLILNKDNSNESLEMPEKRKWVTLDVFESLWLLMIVELRKLNLDLKTIKKLKEYLNESIDVNILISSIKDSDLKNHLLSNPFNKEVEELIGGIDAIDELIESLPTAIKEMQENDLFNNLAIALHGVFITKSNPSILIQLNNNGDDFDFHLLQNNMSDPNGKEALFQFYNQNSSQSTFINLPITKIAEKLFEKEHLVSHCTDYGFFTNQERQLFDSIRNKECEEIHIVKHQSGDFTIKFSKNKEISGEDAKRMRKTLGLKMYDRIEVVYRNDSHLVIKNTNKIIIKKD